MSLIDQEFPFTNLVNALLLLLSFHATLLRGLHPLECDANVKNVLTPTLLFWHGRDKITVGLGPLPGFFESR